MALTLAQAAVLSQDDLQRGIVEAFVQESPVLDRLPLMTIEGNAYAYNKELALPGVAFRNVNEAYVESTGTFVQASESLVIMGGDADVDRFIVKTRGNLNDQRAAQTRAKVKAASYLFQDYFINGDVAVDPKGFDGLKKRLTGGQVLPAGALDLAVVTDEEARSWFDLLDEALGRVPGINGANGAIYMNSRLLAKTKSAGRRVGGTEIVREDMTGKRVLTWSGIPMLDLGQTAAGADILPYHDLDGGGAGTAFGSDVYVVKFGQDETDGAVTGLTNGGVMVDDLGMLQEKPVYRTRIEFYCGLATFSGKAAVRITDVIH